MIATPSTGKLHGQIKQESQSLKLIHRAEASHWVRVGEEIKDISATSESTYKSVSEVRESKMPGGSAVRKLLADSLNATSDKIDQIVRVGSISCPTAHHH